MSKWIAFIGLSLGAIACTPTEQSAPETCPKSQFGSLIGTDINAAILPLTLTYRTIWPGDGVTTDHVPDRINISVSSDGTVQSLSCG